MTCYDVYIIGGANEETHWTYHHRNPWALTFPDIVNAIAEKEGLNVEFVNVGWDPLLAGMAQGTYDAAISSITITEDRKKDMLFSDPYF